MRLRFVCVGLASAALACGKSSPDVATSAEAKPGPPAPSNTVPATPTGPVKAPSRGPEHAVYSLADNRLAAHVQRGGGLFIAGGSAGFAKYVRFNNVPKAERAWALGKTDKSGAKVARLIGRQAPIYVPLTAAQAAQHSVRIRAFCPGGGAIGIKANDGKEITGKLPNGWTTVELQAPALAEGENTLVVTMKSPDAAVEWIQIGGAAPPAEDAATIYDDAHRALVLPKEGKLAWYVVPPEKARITGDIEDPACAVDVHAATDDGGVVDGKLVGLGSAVDLAAVAGKPVRIELAGTGCAKAALANAALVVPGNAAAGKRGDAPKYVLFVVMDSLRADRLKPFNPKARPEVPNWEKLAESSTVFLQHYVQGNESQVSHASMWSSTYLAKHRAAQWEDKLADKWMTIDEVAKKAGKYAVGVSANGYIRPSRGFGDSWDKYVNHIERELALQGREIMEAGLAYLQPRKAKPWFLYLGMIDTHVTWRAKQPWMDRYDGGYRGRFVHEFGDEGPTGTFPTDLTEAEKDHVRALYDSNVSYQDDLLGKIQDRLTAWGIWDQTMLIVTADHGDEQWEDQERIGHAQSQQETLIHVPLLVRYPPMFPAGKIASGSEGIDIVPTMADALGVPQDAEWQGASLIPLANGAIGYPLLATSSQYDNFHGGRLASWKVRIAGVGAPRVYNLAKDPLERRDLAGSSKNAIATRALVDPMWMLRQYNVEWKKAVWGNPANVSSKFAAEFGE